MKRIDFKFNSERLVGLTLPADGMMYLSGYNDVHQLNLLTGEADVIEGDPYEFRNNNLTYGLSEEAGVESVGSFRLSHDFASSNAYVNITIKLGDVEKQIQFPILSGDWFFASFSKCGKYLVLADPYELQVFDLSEYC